MEAHDNTGSKASRRNHRAEMDDSWAIADRSKRECMGARARHIAWARRAEQALSNDADTEKIKKAEKMLMQRKVIAKESKG